MSGFTPLQVNSPLAGRIQKINVPRAFQKLLEELGHTVDWRVIRVGERIIRDYDLLFVNIGPISSLNARVGSLGCLWALSQRLPTIIHFDDWQVYQVLQQLKSFVTLGDKQLFKELNGEPFYRNNFPDPMLVAHRAEIFDSASRLRRMWTRWLALCPMYAFGDKQIAINKLQFVPRDNFSFLDITSVVINPYVRTLELPTPKRREWGLASVMPHDDWEKKHRFGWPVNHFGTTKKDVASGKTQVLNTEDDVRNAYAQRWGVLAPEYPQSGSGWWRSRFIYAAQTGSVLYCGQRDGAQLGGPYQWNIGAIEAMPDDVLADTAKRQAETLRPHIWPKDKLKAELVKVLERAQELLLA